MGVSNQIITMVYDHENAYIGDEMARARVYEIREGYGVQYLVFQHTC